MSHPVNDNKFPNGHVLVADDDVTGQMVTATLLERAGYAVDVVANGQEALKALESSAYDLVLMDCMMPVMDGFEATRAIRKAGSTLVNRHIPIIAITALSFSGDRQRCIDAGMNECVSKPIDATKLRSITERFLGGGAAEAKANQQHQDTPTPVFVDEGFMDTVIDGFMQEIPDVVDSLRQALDCENGACLESIGHRLRGSAAVLGASKLVVRASALEAAGKAGDFTLAAKLTPELIDELQLLSAKLSDD